MKLSVTGSISFAVVVGVMLFARVSLSEDCKSVRGLHNEAGWQLPASLTDAPIAERRDRGGQSMPVGTVSQLTIPPDRIVLTMQVATLHDGIVRLRNVRLRLVWASRVDVKGKVYEYFAKAVELSPTGDESVGRVYDVAWIDTTGNGKFDLFRWFGAPIDDVPAWARKAAANP